MIINNATKIFGSFSETPGNNGATFFNKAFSRNNLNAIYLPIKCSETADAINIMNLMNFQGAAFSKPHKVSVMGFLDRIDDVATTIGAVNTVVRKSNSLIGYNTDWIGVHEVLKSKVLEHLYIYGRGGFSRAVQYACNKLNIQFTLLNRYDIIPTSGIIFNASPIEILQDNVLDARPSTTLGLRIFQEQAKIQYQLYTGCLYE